MTTEDVCMLKKEQEMTTIDRLRTLLEEHPNIYPQSQCALILGVSRERIRQLVNLHELRLLLRAPKSIKHYCQDCGKELSTYRMFCAECLYARHHKTLTCTQCSKGFTITMSDYRARSKRKTSHRAIGFFCSRRCFGQYVGRIFGFRLAPKRSYPDSRRYAGVCAFCGTPFSNMRELLRHRNITKELSDFANRRKLINYRRKHTLWQTLAHFRVNQDTLRAIMKGLPTVKHSRSGSTKDE